MTAKMVFRDNTHERKSFIRNSMDGFSKNLEISQKDGAGLRNSQNRVVAHSIESLDPKPWQKQNSKPNELNRCPEKDFENQVSRFYRINLKRSTGFSVMKAAGPYDNQVKDKIKNYCPASVYSQFSSAHQS